MSIQEIILGILILACIAWIIRRTKLCFKRIKNKQSPCEGCPIGCNTQPQKCENEKK